MKLHASGEDYLETILVLQKKLGMVRSVDVARHMEVSKPSVCHAVATLRDGGFLMMDEDHILHLTDVGREVAEKIYERHCFFTVRRSARYSYNLVLVKSVRRTRSHRMKFCVQRGLCVLTQALLAGIIPESE